MGINEYRTVAGCAAAFVAVTLAVPVNVWAQAMDEITVTTRRREERLQDVPIAVSALTSEQIQRQGITDLTDVANLTPSVQFDNAFSPADTRITIRGLANSRGRSNVAFLVDGIDVTTENLISAGSGLLANRRLLNDVERIEVVKGPQSALYGRAAFAGAISYVTRDPGDELEGRVSLDLADDGYYQVDGAIGGPVIRDLLGLRLNGVYWSEDGRFQNTVSGADFGGGEGYGAALKAVFTPGERLRIEGRVEYSDDDYTPRPFVRIGGGLTQKEPDWELRAYDPNIVLGDNPIGKGNAFSGGAIGLVEHALTNLAPLSDCPEEFQGDYTVLGGCAGFYLPRSYGNGKKDRLAHSEDALTCEEVPLPGGGFEYRNCDDYAGTRLETIRGSVEATYDLSFATLASYTGFTDAWQVIREDQDFQAMGRPDRIISNQQSFSEQDTHQFSQEFRFSSSWDGPVQLTLGALYWQDDRVLNDQNYIISCLPFGKDPFSTIDVNGTVFNLAKSTETAGLCDGTGGSVGQPVGTQPSRFVWQEYDRQIQPRADVFWDAETDHESYYAMLEIELSDKWSLTLENRYVEEEFDILRPNQSSCATLGFTVSDSPLAPLRRDETVKCLAQQILDGDVLDFSSPPDADGNFPPIDPFSPVPENAGPTDNTWRYIVGSEKSEYNTPKVTLEWQPTADSLVYLFWGHAQKPGGINQLAAGGTAVTIEDQRFKPEKLDAWEIGTKTSWEAAGLLQINSALFFQDYTDKQVSTQELRKNTQGALVSTPLVINASAAEVWGIEVDALWQPLFIDGLTLSLAYTYLDAEYTDFVDFSTSAVRSAMVGSCPVVWFDASNDIVATGRDVPMGFAADDVVAKCSLDLSGNKLERTPEHAVVSAVSLVRPFLDQGFDWRFDFVASWQDKRFVDQDNFVRWDAYWQVDAQLSLIGDNWDFIAYVDNLTDDDTLRSGGSGPDFGQQVVDTGFTAGLGVTHFFGPLTEPRQFGIRATYRF